ncbi:hypothetical protein LZ31DRAFT_78241 [Colletotrichum somersetense]|nr:hypothetical protein LZ31DRAFT_78241 [Colletotrichum somersetense]
MVSGSRCRPKSDNKPTSPSGHMPRFISIFTFRSPARPPRFALSLSPPPSHHNPLPDWEAHSRVPRGARRCQATADQVGGAPHRRAGLTQKVGDQAVRPAGPQQGGAEQLRLVSFFSQLVRIRLVYQSAVSILLGMACSTRVWRRRRQARQSFGTKRHALMCAVTKSRESRLIGQAVRVIG